MTTDLDTRIRRAVIEIVEATPPPPTFDELTTWDLARTHRRRGPILAFAAFAVVVAIALAILLVPGGSDSQVASAPTSRLTVRAEAAIKFDRDMYQVPAGRVRVTLSGALGHTLTFADPKLRKHVLLTTDPGGPHSATVTLRPGTYTIYCVVPGHRAQGMHATITAVPRAPKVSATSP